MVHNGTGYERVRSGVCCVLGWDEVACSTVAATTVRYVTFGTSRRGVSTISLPAPV